MRDNNIVVPELVDGCRMSCALCWNRNRHGSMENMSLDIVREIVKKHKKYTICWFNWGEPLWHTDFEEVSDIIEPTVSFVSSSFSLPISDDYLSALTKWKRVYISLSGMTQDVYEIYNRGGNIDSVFLNLERFLATNHQEIIIRWQSHPLNRHQKEKAFEYCESKGIKFMPIPLNCEVEDLIEGFDHELLRKPKFNHLLNDCVISRQLPIGVDGSYLLCCATHNVKTGYTIFDDISEEELLKKRMDLPLCQTCRERKLFQMYC